VEHALTTDVSQRPPAASALRLSDLLVVVPVTLGGVVPLLVAFRMLAVSHRGFFQANLETLFLLLLLGAYLAFGAGILLALRRFPDPMRLLRLRPPSSGQVLLLLGGLGPWFIAEAGVAWLTALAFNGGKQLPNNARDLFPQVPRGAGILILALFVAAVLVPLCEEVFFRGMVYGFLRTQWPIWAAVLLSSLLFGLAHFGHILLLPIFTFMGIVLALVYEFSGSLTNSILLHAFNNAVLTLVTYSLLSR